MSDPVNRPAHYTVGGIETRDFIAAKGLNFDRGSAIKYIVRAGLKDPAKEIEDLEKAISCIKHDIARLKQEREIEAALAELRDAPAVDMRPAIDLSEVKP